MLMEAKSNIIELYDLMKKLVLIVPTVTDDLWVRDIDSLSMEEINIISELRQVIPELPNLVMSSDIVTALDDMYEELSSKGMVPTKNDLKKGR